jgi:hypothetical protein
VEEDEEEEEEGWANELLAADNDCRDDPRLTVATFMVSELSFFPRKNIYRKKILVFSISELSGWKCGEEHKLTKISTQNSFTMYILPLIKGINGEVITIEKNSDHIDLL